MTQIYIPEDSPFLTTDTRKNRWAIPYSFECLNARIENLLGRNEDAIRGKRILDIGSHIGTFDYAACQMGAHLVHGIDTEEKTVERCLDLFRSQNLPASQYQFEVADALAFLENLPENSFDTVFCFGMLYYTAEPVAVLRQMGRVARETVLLDTFTAGYAAIQGKDSASVYPAIKEETLDLPLMIVSLTQPDKKDYLLPQSFEHKGKMLSQITAHCWKSGSNPWD
jgi:SAM-dependent methyltransferase